MTDPHGRSPAGLLVRTLALPAVAVDADDRVLAWNTAAETNLGMTPDAAGHTLAALGLSGIPGATRLAVAEGSADGAAAIVAWDGPVARADVTLQKIRALARLAPGVNHQGRNHLAGFGAFFGMLHLDKAFVTEYGETLLRDLEENARRAPELLGAFAELARDRDPAPSPQPLASRVGQALLLTEYAMDVERAVAVPADLPEVLADMSRLHQALVAILVNALDALGGPKARGRLAVSASVVDGPEGPGAPVVRLLVEDTAPLVPERDRAHLFDRFPPAGTCARAGLDLAVARRLLEADGGTLRYEATPDGYNRLVATLVVPGQQPSEAADGRQPADRRTSWPAPTSAVPPPSAARPSAPAAPTSSPVEPRAGQLTVLVCDDEPALRDLMVRVLERNRHRVLLAASGAEALATLDAQHVDIVMSDHNMSTMTGVELYTAACERHPRLRRRFILMSGDPGESAIQSFSSSTGLPVLAKPFTFTALENTIRSLAKA